MFIQTVRLIISATIFVLHDFHRCCLAAMRIATISLVLLVSGQYAVAQDANSAANKAFGDAIALHSEMSGLTGEAAKNRAQEIVRMLDLIAVAYPESIAGKRILDGGQLGPIDLAALRVLSGDQVDEALASATDLAVEGSSHDEAGLNAGNKPAQDEVTPPLEWYQTIVRDGELSREFVHGAFPVLGPRTYAGQDIIASCGSEVGSATQGEVVRIVKAGDAEFDRAGNAVLVRTDARVYGYFKLEKTPDIALGPIEKGALLGKAGRLDHGECGVHLEVRKFEVNAMQPPVFHPLWDKLHAVGDWSADVAFTHGWSDPVELIAAQHRIAQLLDGQVVRKPVAQVRGAALFAGTPMNRLYEGRNFERGFKFKNGFYGKIFGSFRATPDGVELRIKRASANNFNLLNYGIKAENGYERPLVLRLAAKLNCAECDPHFEAKRHIVVREESVQHKQVTFLIPLAEAQLAETLVFEIFDGEDSAMVTPQIFLGKLRSPSGEAAEVEVGEVFLRRFNQCVAWQVNAGQILTLSGHFTLDGRFDKLHLVQSVGFEESSGLEALLWIKNRMKTCGGKLIDIENRGGLFKAGSWVEITLFEPVSARTERGNE